MIIFFAGLACGALGMLGLSFIAATKTHSPHGHGSHDASIPYRGENSLQSDNR